MARHTILIPDLMHGRELRTIIWDDEAGTVEGNHSRIEDFQREFAAPKPVTRGDVWGTWQLHDPAHDPAEFFILLWVTCNDVRYEPLRSTLPAVFDGIELPPPHQRDDILYDEDGNVMI